MEKYTAMDLIIAIVNYNTKNLVKYCVKNIISLNLPLSYQIIIIDNNSSDGSADFIEKHLIPRNNNVKLIRTSKNIGFGKGYNYGLKGVHCRYVLLINSDIIIQNDSIQNLYRFMEENEQCAIAGPKLLYPDQSVQQTFHRWPKMLTPIYRRTFLGKFSFGLRELKRYDMKESDGSVPTSCDWVVGACMLIRKKIWDMVGGFDVRYFLYYEDIDICREVSARGYEVWYYPDTHIIHYHKRLSAGKKWWLTLFDKTARIHIASHIKYFRKWGV